MQIEMIDGPDLVTRLAVAAAGLVALSLPVLHFMLKDRRAPPDAAMAPVRAVGELGRGAQWQRLSAVAAQRIAASKRARHLHERAGVAIDATELEIERLVSDIGSVYDYRRRRPPTRRERQVAPRRVAA